jgi:hypothetical protein
MTPPLVIKHLDVVEQRHPGVAVAGKPAREEERKLLSLGIQFKRSPRVPPLAVQTKGGTISTLICSELLEVERPAALMGRIDLLLVPSWNPDTATFDHTIQTTANDVHCYVAIRTTQRGRKTEPVMIPSSAAASRFFAVFCDGRQSLLMPAYQGVHADCRTISRPA